MDREYSRSARASAVRAGNGWGLACGAPIASFLAMLGGLAAASQVPEPSPPAPYSRPARLTPVEGGRRLNLVCMGGGTPTVVLEAGLGDSSAVWRKVQATTASKTRVCAYDRAGYGFSDPAAHPSDARQAASDLHALLARAHIRTPVVLVGHSLGGLYAQLFAATYPRSVAGLVLVDPTGLDDFRLGREIMTEDERQRFRANHLKRLADIGGCLDLARAGGLAIAPPPECRAEPTGDAGRDAALAAQLATPRYWAAYQSETANFYPVDHPAGAESVITRQVRERPLRLGDRPLILLRTPGRVPPGERGERLRAASRAAAERLVSAASRRGRVVDVDCGHYVQLERPEAVAAAVDEVISIVRRGTDPER